MIEQLSSAQILIDSTREWIKDIPAATQRMKDIEEELRVLRNDLCGAKLRLQSAHNEMINEVQNR